MRPSHVHRSNTKLTNTHKKRTQNNAQARRLLENPPCKLTLRRYEYKNNYNSRLYLKKKKHGADDPHGTKNEYRDITVTRVVHERRKTRQARLKLCGAPLIWLSDTIYSAQNESLLILCSTRAPKYRLHPFTRRTRQFVNFSIQTEDFVNHLPILNF